MVNLQNSPNLGNFSVCYWALNGHKIFRFHNFIWTRFATPYRLNLGKLLIVYLHQIAKLWKVNICIKSLSLCSLQHCPVPRQAGRAGPSSGPETLENLSGVWCGETGGMDMVLITIIQCLYLSLCLRVGWSLISFSCCHVRLINIFFPLSL